MSFAAGLIWGLAIAAIEVGSEHYGPSFGRFSLKGNGAFAVPTILVPLAIFWGWSWIANRWSGRSLPPTVLYTAGLYLGTGFVSPADALLFPQSEQSTLVGSIPGLLLSGAIFVLPAAVLAGIIYWLLRSERFPASPLVLTILYLIGLPLGAIIPMIPMGTVAGTATGHAWRRAGGRTGIGLLVIALMVIAGFAVPFLLSGGAEDLRRLTAPP